MSETIIEYVKTEMRTFAEHPFHEVDSLVLSQFSYIHLGNLIAPPEEGNVKKPLTLQQLYRAECFAHFFADQPDAAKNRRLLAACAASPRFRNIGIAYYEQDFDETREKQFCAMTFFLDADTAYLAFRGTDSSLVGWKEDFNMAFLTPVPSQEAALNYTLTVAKLVRGQLLLGGHSKGGNLAVYAAMMSPSRLQNRITGIYSHDGPGFRDNMFSSAGYLRISDRIHKTLPQSSLVGMLLEHQKNYAIVESTGVGIVQHNPYSWIVRDGSFVRLTTLTSGADFLNRTLSEWLSGLANEQREQFVDALYSVISATDLTSFVELRDNWQVEFPALIETMKNMDEPTRRILHETLRSLMHMAVKNLPAQVQKEQSNHKKAHKQKNRKRGTTDGSEQDQ